MEKYVDKMIGIIREENKSTIQYVHDENERTKLFLEQQLGELKEMIKGLSGLSKDTDVTAHGNHTAAMVDVTADEEKGYAGYEQLDVLGTGSQGVVLLVRQKSTDKYFAMKEIYCRYNMVEIDAVREAYLIYEADHDNIVRLWEVYIKEGSVSLVMDYIPNTLKKKIEKREITDTNVKVWLYQLLQALSYIHSQGIVHRDIKPENLLITDDNVLKVGDFGISRGFLNQAVTPERGTLYYRPPEDLVEVPYGKSFDIWGVGCVFYEMVEGKLLFGPADSGNDVLRNIYRVLGTPTDNSWLQSTSTVPTFAENYTRQSPLTTKLDNVGNDLLMRLLDLEPNTRITAEAALNHPYFAVN